MLKTSGSTESTTRPGKGKVGVGSDGGGDGGDDSGHDDKHLSRGSEQAHQRTHQLVRPGLWSSMMRLIEVRVVLLASRSKSHQKVEKLSKVKKPQKPEESQKSSIRENIYQNTDPPSIRYEKLKLPLALWQFFKLFLLGSGILSIPHSEQLLSRQS